MPVRVTPLSSVYESVSEKTAMPMMSSSRPGMMYREYFSMPFSTPQYTTHAVSARKISMKTMGETGEVMNEVKNPSCAASLPLETR